MKRSIDNISSEGLNAITRASSLKTIFKEDDLDGFIKLITQDPNLAKKLKAVQEDQEDEEDEEDQEDEPDGFGYFQLAAKNDAIKCFEHMSKTLFSTAKGKTMAFLFVAGGSEWK